MISKRTKYRRQRKLIDTEKLVKVKNGVYVRPNELVGIEGDFYFATLIYGKKSAICFSSALKYYGLSAKLTGKIQILISYGASAPQRKSIQIIRSRKPRFQIGIKRENKFSITTLERTLVELFHSPKYFSPAEAIYALKEAIEKKLTDKKSVYMMAKKLHCEEKILPYLEAI